MKPLTDITTFPQLPPRLILLLFGGTNFAESQLNIRRELKGWSMERSSFLF
jgi:hypothetical protein